MYTNLYWHVNINLPLTCKITIQCGDGTHGKLHSGVPDAHVWARLHTSLGTAPHSVLAIGGAMGRTRGGVLQVRYASTSCILMYTVSTDNTKQFFHTVWILIQLYLEQLNWFRVVDADSWIRWIFNILLIYGVCIITSTDHHDRDCCIIHILNKVVMWHLSALWLKCDVQLLIHWLKIYSSRMLMSHCNGLIKLEKHRNWWSHFN